MSTDHNDLFHDSGLSGMLDYLSARLSAGDLTPDEALAMLGAVHEGLSSGDVADRSMFQQYSEIMRSLSQTMPEVHDFVVSEWSKRIGKESTRTDFWDEPGDEEEVAKSEAEKVRTQIEAAGGTEEVEVEEEEAEGEEDQEEPDEEQEETEGEGEAAEIEAAETESDEDEEEGWEEAEEPEEQEELDEAEKEEDGEGEGQEEEEEEEAEGSEAEAKTEASADEEPEETEWPEFEENGVEPEESFPDEEDEMPGVD